MHDSSDFNPRVKDSNSPTRLYLVRHGQPRGHEEKRMYGHQDTELGDEGIAHLHRLGIRLKDEAITAIYSSDLKRSYEGARILAQYLRLTPQTPLRDLRERSFGAFEGLTWQEIEERFPGKIKEMMSDWIGYCAPGAESIKDLERRVVPTLKELLKKHKGKRIALVGHGGVNRVILLNALGMSLNRLFSFEQDYGCLNIIDYYPEGTVIRLLNG